MYYNPVSAFTSDMYFLGESTSSLPDDGWDEDESDEDDSGGYQDYYRSDRH